jgi:glycosyltransferase involved in cell wall biosynthesis
MSLPATVEVAQNRQQGALRRVLFLVHSYPPSTNVAVQRTTRFIRYLPLHGWQADVVAPGEPMDGAGDRVPGVGEVVRAPEWLPLKAAVEVRNRLRRAWPGASGGASAGHAAIAASSEEPVSAPHGRSLLARYVEPWLSTPDEHIAWYRSARRAAAHTARTRGSEVLYTSGPPHSAHLIAMRLRKALGIPWVADFRDPWSRRPWLSAEDRRGLRYATLVRMEARVVATADRIILNTEAMAEEFRQHYPAHASRCLAITNGYDPAMRVEAGTSAPSRAVLTLIHAGSLYRRRDPRPLLEALAHLVSTGQVPAGRIALRLLGHVDAAFGVPRLVQALGLEGIVGLEGRVSHAETLEALGTSHVLVLLQPGTHLQVPAKLFEYMQTGRWILALTPEGATADIVRRYALGSVVAAEDVPAIAATLAGLWRQFSSGAALKVETTQALEAFDGRRLTGVLARILDEVTRR